ncbi:MAG: DUF1028 domain-containing protein [Geminicoccaceae bacterium]
MTFAVLALDKRTGWIGGAAATGNLAVGAWVLRAAPNAGAVATLGYSVSSLWGDEALSRLKDGEPAETIVSALTDQDTGRDHRQLAVLDKEGRSAAWTGARNTDNKGHLAGETFIVVGNWLSSLDVLHAMKRAFEDQSQEDGEAFGHRLLSTIAGGAAAGSDSRGTLSAAVRIVGSDRPPLDLRVDLDEQPIAKLKALYDLATNPPYSDWARGLPTIDKPFRC